MCPREYDKLRGNFSASYSPLFKGNNGYLTVCKHCVDDLYNHYLVALGNEAEAIRRVCMKLDIYFSDELVKISGAINVENSRMRAYISKVNLIQYGRGKTYDSTLDEERDIIDSFDDVRENKTIKISQKTVKFFGLGFTEDEYQSLQNQYDDWIARHECKTKAQEELFKNLCITQLGIQKAMVNGTKVDNLMDMFQKLLGSANLKPTQTNENALADQNTFGTLIKKWEDERPIPEPDPEWKDVDGIHRYISVWFLGHLCKMMGIKNTYSKLYEEEIEKYRVERPEYFDEESDEFDNMFGGGADG